MILEVSYTPQQHKVFHQIPQGTKYITVRKGRRFGLTHGGANAFIEWGAEGEPLMWGDTIHGNIDKYVERYFLPTLNKSGIQYKYNTQKKQMNFLQSGGYIDFRSADNPENWEGFGYKKIFLNEAGIILKNPYLYTNAVLPMLMDHSDSVLIAGGVPKGKTLKNGEDHPFWSLVKRGQEGHAGHVAHAFTSYDNPLLTATDIHELEKEIGAMNPAMIRQEIYGEFIDDAAATPFIYTFDMQKHANPNYLYDPDHPIYLSFDFNLNPLTCTVFQFEVGRFFHAVDSFKMDNANLPDMLDMIKSRYSEAIWNAQVTGDAMGRNRTLMERENRTYYDMIQARLGLSKRQIDVPPNPSHSQSRMDCNYVFRYHPGVNINPVKCSELLRDIRIVEATGDNSIVKSNRGQVAQQADFLDNFRYAVNTWLYKWIKTDMKRGEK